MADKIIDPADVLASANGRVKTGNAEAAIGAGKVIAIDTDNGSKIALASADGAAAAPLKIVAGITVNEAAAADQPIQYVEVDETGIALGAIFTTGEMLVLSATTPGAMATITDLVSTDQIVPLGVAKDGSTLYFRPLNPGVAIA